MARTSVHITPGLCIASLLMIEHPRFHAGYEQGVAWSLFHRETTGPLDDLHLPDRLTAEIVHCPSYFEARNEQSLCWRLGFWLGMVHGGVLLPNGSLAPGVTSLVKLRDRQCRRGYDAGRHYHFTEAETDEQRMMTDTHIVEQRRELASEYGIYEDSQGTLRYTMGGVLGRLSGVLFPWTAEEHARMEQESLRILGYVEPLRPGCLAYQMSLQPA
jgi:hypothetical protein